MISHRKAKGPSFDVLPLRACADARCRCSIAEALAASTVKIAARDVLSSWKVLVSLGLTPSIYILYTLIGEYLAWRWSASTTVRWAIPAYVFIGFPFLAVAALKFGEAAMDVMKSLPPLLINLTPGNEKQIQRVKETREALSEELSGVISACRSLPVNVARLSADTSAVSPSHAVHFGPQLFEVCRLIELIHRAHLLTSALIP